MSKPAQHVDSRRRIFCERPGRCRRFRPWPESWFSQAHRPGQCRSSGPDPFWRPRRRGGRRRPLHPRAAPIKLVVMANVFEDHLTALWNHLRKSQHVGQRVNISPKIASFSVSTLTRRPWIASSQR